MYCLSCHHMTAGLFSHVAAARSINAIAVSDCKRKLLYALKVLCLMAVRCVNTALIFHSRLSSSSLTRQGKTAVTISSTH